MLVILGIIIVIVTIWAVVTVFWATRNTLALGPLQERRSRLEEWLKAALIQAPACNVDIFSPLEGLVSRASYVVSCHSKVALCFTGFLESELLERLSLGGQDLLLLLCAARSLVRSQFSQIPERHYVCVCVCVVDVPTARRRTV